MGSEPVLLQPHPGSLSVSLHPRHNDTDAVSMSFVDAVTGHRYLVAVIPEFADYLATLLATAVKSTRIQARADQMKAAQREGE